MAEPAIQDNIDNVANGQTDPPVIGAGKISEKAEKALKKFGTYFSNDFPIRSVASILHSGPDKNKKAASAEEIKKFGEALKRLDDNNAQSFAYNFLRNRTMSKEEMEDVLEKSKLHKFEKPKSSTKVAENKSQSQIVVKPTKKQQDLKQTWEIHFPAHLKIALAAIQTFAYAGISPAEKMKRLPLMLKKYGFRGTKLPHEIIHFFQKHNTPSELNEFFKTYGPIYGFSTLSRPLAKKLPIKQLINFDSTKVGVQKTKETTQEKKPISLESATDEKIAPKTIAATATTASVPHISVVTEVEDGSNADQAQISVSTSQPKVGWEALGDESPADSPTVSGSAEIKSVIEATTPHPNQTDEDIIVTANETIDGGSEKIDELANKRDELVRQDPEKNKDEIAKIDVEIELTSKAVQNAIESRDKAHDNIQGRTKQSAPADVENDPFADLGDEAPSDAISEKKASDALSSPTASEYPSSPTSAANQESSLPSEPNVPTEENATTDIPTISPPTPAEQTRPPEAKNTQVTQTPSDNAAQQAQPTQTVGETPEERKFFGEPEPAQSIAKDNSKPSPEVQSAHPAPPVQPTVNAAQPDLVMGSPASMASQPDVDWNELGDESPSEPKPTQTPTTETVGETPEERGFFGEPEPEMPTASNIDEKPDNAQPESQSATNDNPVLTEADQKPTEENPSLIPGQEGLSIDQADEAGQQSSGEETAANTLNPNEQTAVAGQMGQETAERRMHGESPDAGQQGQRENLLQQRKSIIEELKKLGENFKEIGLKQRIIRFLMPGLHGKINDAIEKIKNKKEKNTEKRLQAAITTLKALKILLQGVKVIASLIDGLMSWIRAIFATLETIILPIIILFLLPGFLIIYLIFGGRLAKAVKDMIKPIDQNIKILEPLLEKAKKKRLLKNELKMIDKMLSDPSGAG